MAPQQSIDHHFVPQFYLKRWAGPDEKVCEFTRPYKKLVVRSKTPKTTGFQKHLYTISSLPPEKRSVLEDVWFKDIDQMGSDALDFMLGNPTGEKEMPNKLRCGWSRFLMSLMHRSPQNLAALKEMWLETYTPLSPKLEREYLLLKQAADPGKPSECSEDVQREIASVGFATLVESVTDNRVLGSFFNTMHWSIVTVGNPEYHLLTSDHPLVMTNGIEHPEGYVITPVGPTQVFIAVNSAEKAAEIKDTDPRYLIPKLNDTMVRQAVDYVYDTDERQQRFVENRFKRLSS